MNLIILGEPKPKQSFRFAIRGNDEKKFVAKYQPKEVVHHQRTLGWTIQMQLPKGFIPLDEPLKVEVLFVFSPPAAWSKKKMEELTSGKVIYKDTKPDLDNLEKALWDAMEGIVFINDSRIVKKSIKKVYGVQPRTEIKIEVFNEAVIPNPNPDLLFP